MNTDKIPQYIIDAINNDEDFTIRKSDMHYLVELKNKGYITYKITTDFDTDDGYDDIAITRVIKRIV